jgi:hypothetical protein
MGRKATTCVQPQLQPVACIQHRDAVFGVQRRSGPRCQQLGSIGPEEHPDPGEWQLQFAAQFINALNHPQLTAPTTTPTSTAFGQLTGSYNWQRIIEFGVKVAY